MATVRTQLRFSPPIGVDLEVLGRTLAVPVFDTTATVELPRYEWRADRVVATPPTSAAIGVAHFKRELFESDDDLISWGASWRYNAVTRQATMDVGAAMASVEVDGSLIERSNYLYGVGQPQGEVVRQVRLDLDAWRSRFVEWVSLISGQAVSPLTPPVPNRARPEAPGTLVWVEEDGRVVGLPSMQSDHVTIVMDRDEPEVLGFVLDQALFDRVIALASTAEEPSTQLRLLRSARIAIRRYDYRLAVIELGSAAELCLWTLFDTTVRASTPPERDSWTLGRLVREVYSAADPMRATLKHGLVDPRNDAIHRAQPCDRAVALSAFALARQLVSDELSEGLPST